jgi:hypothetical protein
MGEDALKMWANQPLVNFPQENLHRERQQQLSQLEFRKNNGERRGYQSKVSLFTPKKPK